MIVESYSHWSSCAHILIRKCNKADSEIFSEPEGAADAANMKMNP